MIDAIFFLATLISFRGVDQSIRIQRPIKGAKGHEMEHVGEIG